MRIAIVGAGGVGAYFGARLQAAGNEVAFLARGAQLAALRAGGLRLTGRSGELHLPAVAASDDPAALGPADAVLVAVKSWQLAELAPRLTPLVAPHTVVVPLLNGVEAADELASALGPGPVAAGLCGIVSFLVAPGHVHHEGADPFVRFGELDDRPSPRLARLAEAFTRAGVRAEIAPDIRAALWQKLLFIAPVSAVAALVRTTLGEWRALAGPRDLATRAMREVVAVAAARGVALAGDAVERTLGFLDALEPSSTPSMQRDFESGRRSELEAQIGAVVRLGAAARVETPAARLLYDCLLPQELAARAAAAGA
ncbi:MAG: 2-dehydropantoate 2-reductase [Thermoanaerobaculia bacterium]|nr:2-dehydropantoate 2-reductase [Thermoanaerobaculia bacterium]